jgi:hypothetical protein
VNPLRIFTQGQIRKRHAKDRKAESSHKAGKEKPKGRKAKSDIFFA